jgi:hypothetical protein
MWREIEARRAALACAALVLLAVTESLRAGSYFEDFSDGVANNMSLNGGRLVGDPPTRMPAPPVVENGNLRITGALNNWQASAILGDLDPGVAVRSFSASFALAIGPGSAIPADGLSFLFGQLNDTSEFGEEGPDAFNGLTISADIYDNGGGEAPAIEVKLDGVVVAGGRSTQNPYTNGAFVPVIVNFDPNGTLDLSITGVGPIFTDLQTGFVPETGDRFGWGARTGGLNAEHRIDDVNITTVPVPEPAGLALLGAGALGLLTRGRRA